MGWHSELTLQSNRVWSPGLWCWEERRKQRGSFVITHLTATRGSWVAPHSKMAVVPLMTRLSMGGLDMDVRPWSKHNTVNSALVQHFQETNDYASLFNSFFTHQHAECVSLPLRQRQDFTCSDQCVITSLDAVDITLRSCVKKLLFMEQRIRLGSGKNTFYLCPVQNYTFSLI